jgi:hypothetical protein
MPDVNGDVSGDVSSASAGTITSYILYILPLLLLL